MEDKPLVNASPARIIEAMAAVPDLSKRNYFGEHFYGHRIRVAGVVNSLSDGTSDAFVRLTNESDATEVTACFGKPISPELHLLRKGDYVALTGRIFDCGPMSFMLDQCTIDVNDTPSISSHDSASTDNPNTSAKSKWSDAWWANLTIQTVAAIVGGLISSLIVAYIAWRYFHN